ncbi:MAG: indole-3-glycerol phosphate synthase TrpC [Candidatus Melainabacteria bacterium]|nr:indole-3-glycerol phosphate synthase TrpC [Candidatus Melainabacteria bacterium]
MTILDEIVAHKREEIKSLDEFEELEDRIFDLSSNESMPLTKGFLKALRDAEGPSLIAEVKKASPSKGVIREDFDPVEIAKQYEAGGAHCISVLTDSKYFQGSFENLVTVSSEVQIPCLCKEFIIHPKQVAQARLMGADAVLLIAAILADEEIEDLRYIANEYGMDVLLEVHSEDEMERALRLESDLIGINNRNLETFEVSLDTSSKLISRFKYDLGGVTLVSESGINSKADILILYNMGVKGFLVGESLMRQDDLKSAVENLVL